MRSPRHVLIVLLAALLLVVSACGDDGGDAEDVSTDTSNPETTEPEAAEDLTGLDQAFAEAASATSYRIRQYNAQTMQSSALGVDTETEIDPDRPAVVGEISADRSHMEIDITSMLGPMAATDEPVVLEMWTGPDRLVVDTTSYAQIADQNPGADLGPLAPGIAYVDLARVGADSPDLLAALVGTGFVDMAEIAERLPAALQDVEQAGDGTYRGRAPYADVVEAMGGDIEQTARGLAAGLALNLQVDPAAVAQLYTDYYREVLSEVTVEVDGDTVRAVEVHTDLSDIYERIFAPGSGLDLGLSEAELSQAQDAFADTVLTVTARVVFEAAPDLEVPEPPATDDDRTDAWIALLETAG